MPAFASHQSPTGAGTHSTAAETRVIDAVVFALIPEFDQVKVRGLDGHIYALTRKTRGVELEALHQGQQVRCTVTRHLPRVLRAEALA